MRGMDHVSRAVRSRVVHIRQFPLQSCIAHLFGYLVLQCKDTRSPSTTPTEKEVDQDLPENVCIHDSFIYKIGNFEEK